MRTRANFIVLLLCALPLWVVWVALQVCSVGYGVGVGLLDVLVAALILVFFGAIACSLRTKNWQVPLYIGVILGAYFCAIPPSERISRWQWRASILEAQSLIAAVESFHHDQGIYPNSIQQLIPAYLPAEPRTKMGLFGDRFEFIPDSNGFRLEFYVPWSKWWTYDSESKEWTVSD